MKNIIGLLIIVLFFSCTAKKLVQQSKVEQKTTQQNSITDAKTSQAEVKKTIVDQSSNDIEIVTKTVIYDTDKPISETTGKPPVKQEIITTQKNAERNDVKTNIDFIKKDESTHKDQSKADSQREAENKTIEKTKPSGVRYYFYIALIICILLTAFFVRKYLVNIKNFFGFFS